MAQYKVQAPDGKMITIEGPDGATDDEIISQAKRLYEEDQAKQQPSLAKGLASAADVGINLASGLLESAAYQPARAYYGLSLPPEQAAARAKKETELPKDILGRFFNIIGQPAYEQEASRRALRAVGEAVSPYIEPVIGKIQETTSAPRPDIQNMLETSSMLLGPPVGRAVAKPVMRAAEAIEPVVAPMANMAGRAAGAVTRPITAAARTPGQIVQGMVNEPGTALATLESRMIKPQAVKDFEAGKISSAQVLDPQNVVNTNDVLSSNLDKLARVISNNQVPYVGQFGQAFGERLRQNYINRPYGLPTDILASVMAGFPLPITGLLRGGQTVSDLLLQRKLGLSPRFASEFERRAAQEAAQQATLQKGFQVSGAVAPQQPVATTFMPKPTVAGTTAAAGQVTPTATPTVNPSQYFQNTNPINGTGMDALSSGFSQQVKGVTQPITITEPPKPTTPSKPKVETTPSSITEPIVSNQTARPNLSVAETIAEKVQRLGLQGEAAKKAVIESMIPEIQKRAKAEGVIISKETAKAMATKEAEAYFEKGAKAEAAQRAEIRKQKQEAEERRLAEENAARQAYEASPEGQAARAKAEAEEKAKALEAENQRKRVQQIVENINANREKRNLADQNAIKAALEERKVSGAISPEDLGKPSANKPLTVEEAPELFMPSIRKPPTPKITESPPYQGKETTFPIKDWVTTSQKNGRRTLDEHVLRDIESQTGVKINPADIPDISKMTPKEAKKTMEGAYKKALIPILKNKKS